MYPLGSIALRFTLTDAYYLNVSHFNSTIYNLSFFVCFIFMLYTSNSIIFLFVVHVTFLSLCFTSGSIVALINSVVNIF